MDLMKANELTEIEIVDGQSRIMLRRGAEPGMVQMTAVPQAVVSAATVAGGGAEALAVNADANLKKIESPIVGTFYAAPSPNAEPFAKVGDHVDDNKVVCIVEAMKVMNEVKSEIRGTIKKVLVENGQAVEFGQPLFLVEPD